MISDPLNYLHLLRKEPILSKHLMRTLLFIIENEAKNDIMN